MVKITHTCTASTCADDIIWCYHEGDRIKFKADDIIPLFVFRSCWMWAQKIIEANTPKRVGKWLRTKRKARDKRMKSRIRTIHDIA